MKRRVGFMLIGGKDWTGGYNYLLNLVQVLARETADSIEPVLFVGNDTTPEETAPFSEAGVGTIERDPVFDRSGRTRLLAHALLAGRDTAAEAALKRQGIDVVFEAAAFLGWRSAVPAIAWIPDLQQRFLPHLFSRTAILRRETGFRAQIASGRIVMCSSDDTRRHIERLYRSARGRVHAVRFAVLPGPAITHAQARAVADRHGLLDRYFFMPNQFWAHKNHRLVLQALQLLAGEGRPATVLASGRQHDPRDPAHVPRLLADIGAAGLQDCFRTPGLLPYEDLPALLQASTALLNPSLFEGWSTTVEEAKSGGVPMLLSDLAVHREQADGAATFFDPRSPRSLADALATFPRFDAAQRAESRQTAAARADARIAQFAADFVHVVERAVARH